MDKINFENLPSTNTPLSASNLNTMQSNMEKSAVAISATQPSTTERVWLKKGNNLIDKKRIFKGTELMGDNGTTAPNITYCTTDYIYVKNYNNVYLYGKNTGSGMSNCFYDENKNYITTITAVGGSIQIPSGASYMRLNFKNEDLSGIKLVQGTTEQPYDSDIDKEIFVKNGNGVFEKFLNEENSNNEIYSYGEQKIGTWVDRKTFV